MKGGEEEKIAITGEIKGENTKYQTFIKVCIPSALKIGSLNNKNTSSGEMNNFVYNFKGRHESLNPLKSASRYSVFKEGRYLNMLF